MPTLAPMAVLELACATGAYIHADRQPIVADAVFDTSLAILDGSTLEITCNLKTGALSVQNALSCTLALPSEVSSHQSFPCLSPAYSS